MGLRTFALRRLTARRTQRTRTAIAAGRKERSREQAHFLSAQTFSFPSAVLRHTTPQPQNNAPRLQAWCMVSTSGRFAKLRGCNGSSLHPLFYFVPETEQVFACSVLYFTAAPVTCLRETRSRLPAVSAAPFLRSERSTARRMCAQAAEQHIFIFCALC